jgi:hypothetical protein
MIIIPSPGVVTYLAYSGDWRLVIGDGRFEIAPQVGGWEYSSGVNLDNLATLIAEAKADATARGINWEGN